MGARPRSAADTRATHAAIADAAQSMRTICDTLLDDARDGAATAPGTADVLPVLRRLVERLGPAQKDVEVVVTAQDARLSAGVPDALLERIVSPLLDNALRHARTRVEILARAQPGGVRVEVRDDGSGVPESFATQLFHPGRRADPGDGHGGQAWGCRWRDAWPAPPAGRWATTGGTPPARRSWSRFPQVEHVILTGG